MNVARGTREDESGSKKARRLLLVGGIGLAGVAAAAYFGLSSGEPSQRSEAKPLSVVTIEARAAGSYSSQQRYAGTIVAGTETNLGFEVGGRIRSVAVDVGARVAKGQVLAALDAERLEAVRADLDARLLQARATLSLREEELRRASELVTTGAGSRQRLDEATAQRQAAQGDLASLQAQRRTAVADIRDATLRAPVSGVVAERRISVGDIVTAGAVAFRIIADSEREARIGIPISEVSEFRVGSSVPLEWRGQVISGQIRSIVPEVAAGSRTATVAVSLPRSLDIAAGESITLIKEQERPVQDGIEVPVTALVSDLKGLWAVQLAKPVAKSASSELAVVQRAPVQIVETNGQTALVRGAIRGGDRIIVDGVARVSPGQKVSLAARKGQTR